MGGKILFSLLQAGTLDLGRSDDAENKTRYIKLSEAGSKDQKGCLILYDQQFYSQVDP